MRIPSNVTIEPFQVEHLQEMKLRAFDAKALGYLDSFSTEVAQGFLRGPGWTVRIDGQILGCGGFVILWEGRVEAWVIGTPLLMVYPKLVFSITKYQLDLVKEHFGFRRIEAVTQASFGAGRRFLEHLGFTPESEMKRYGPDGSTHIRYVLLP